MLEETYRDSPNRSLGSRRNWFVNVAGSSRCHDSTLYHSPMQCAKWEGWGWVSLCCYTFGGNLPVQSPPWLLTSIKGLIYILKVNGSTLNSLMSLWLIWAMDKIGRMAGCEESRGRAVQVKLNKVRTMSRDVTWCYVHLMSRDVDCFCTLLLIFSRENC